MKHFNCNFVHIIKKNMEKYKLFTDEVKCFINRNTVFEIINFDLKIDGTSFFLAKYNYAYLNETLLYDIMKLNVDDISLDIITRCNKHFFGLDDLFTDIVL